MKVLITITGAKKNHCGKCPFLDHYESLHAADCTIFFVRRKGVRCITELEIDKKNSSPLRCKACLKAQQTLVTMVTK